MKLPTAKSLFVKRLQLGQTLKIVNDKHRWSNKQLFIPKALKESETTKPTIPLDGIKHKIVKMPPKISQV